MASQGRACLDRVLAAAANRPGDGRGGGRGGGGGWGPQATVVVQAVVGFVLLARGASAPDGLHAAYGIAPLVISLVSEGMRAGVAQRELEGVDDLDALDRGEQVAVARRVALGEMAVMTVGALLILTLALRAYQTGG
jgi:hypothetical protein